MSWRKNFGFNSKLITSKKLNPTLSWAYSRSGWLVQLNCETPSLPLNLWKWVSVRFSRVMLAVDINCTILNLIISSNWWFSRGESFSTSFLTLSLSLGRDLHEKSSVCEKAPNDHHPSTSNRKSISLRPTVNWGKSFSPASKVSQQFSFFSSSSHFSATQDHPRDVRWSPAGAEGFAGAARVFGHRKSDAQHHVDPEEQPAAQR